MKKDFLMGLSDLLSSKLIDTDDVNFIYYKDETSINGKIKINGYCINQTEERLFLLLWMIMRFLLLI